MKLLYTLLLFQDVSGGELIVVLLAVFLLFGPKKAPEIAKNLARGLYKIKKATSDIKEEVDKVIDPLKKEMEAQAKTLQEGLGFDESKKNTPDASKKAGNEGEKPAG